MEFNATRTEQEVMVQIARRAVDLADKFGVDYAQTDALMDIEACHSNGAALQLQELLSADDGNFGHDVFGIRRHINRETGQLEDGFWPRYAK